SRCRLRPINVQVSHGDDSTPGSGNPRRAETTSAGSGSLKRVNAAMSASRWASIKSSVQHAVQRNVPMAREKDKTTSFANGRQAPPQLHLGAATFPGRQGKSQQDVCNKVHFLADSRIALQ